MTTKVPSMEWYFIRLVVNQAVLSLMLDADLISDSDLDIMSRNLLAHIHLLNANMSARGKG